MADDADKKTGISAAVDVIGADEAGLGWSGQQLSLLPSGVMVGEGFEDAEKRPEAGKRGKGRPPGAGNKSTLDWVKYISARYTNPLIFLAECFNRPAEELAKELKCTTEKAFSFQMAAATKLVEYTNQKMPTTLDLGVDGDLSLFIGTTYTPPAGAPGDDAQPVGGVVITLPAEGDDAETGDEGDEVAQDVVPDPA